MPDHEDVAIRILEVEAEMNEAQAVKFAELASCISDAEHKRKLEELSTEATEKAVKLRERAGLLRLRHIA